MWLMLLADRPPRPLLLLLAFRLLLAALALVRWQNGLSKLRGAAGGCGGGGAAASLDCEHACAISICVC